MADTTTKGHGEAVKAVAGQADPEEVVVTRDLKSEQESTQKLVEETEKALNSGDGVSPFRATLEGDERKQVFARTLPNGKTEAVLEEAPALPTFPPDDGGYNPEKRTHAGPAGTMTPQAAEAHRLSQTAGASDVPAGWREENRV